jgi:hypothetical protein
MSRERVTSCSKCGGSMTWGRTYPGGKPMPIDVEVYATDDEKANLAAYKDATGRLNVRVLKAGEQPEPYERRRMPHFATCAARLEAAAARRGEVENVIPFPTRAKRTARR